MPNNPQRQRRKGRFETAAIFGGGSLIFIAGLILAFQFVQPAPPRTVRIAAGPASGAYHGYAERYAEILARYGIALEVEETAGSLENLSLLKDADAGVALALIQGGVATTAQKKGLAGLGSLFYEPLWLLGHDGGASRQLNRIQGLRIGIGPPSSGTAFLAHRLLSANGIGPDQAEIEEGDLQTAIGRLADAELDLVFAVAAPDSDLLRGLLREETIRIQDLPRAPAYARIDRSLTALDLPAGTLDLRQDIPNEDLHLSAVTANLVARDDLHPALVDLLITAANEVHGGGDLLAPPGTFPSPRHSDFALQPDALRHYKNGPPFLQRYLPFWAATWIDRTKVMLLPLLALLLPLSKMLPPVYRWRVRQRILRWYVALRRIDLELETGISTPINVTALRQRLSEIESEVTQVDIPLSYTDQLYNLRLHIRLLEQKLSRMEDAEGAADRG
ncbi:MAG: TAXI family TRAP transporter solute-binding subunit [Chromatiaceae bacterium]